MTEQSITWESNPEIVKQITPWIGLPEYLNGLLLELLGPPFFHWWILSELVYVCKKQLPFYVIKGDVHIIEVAVYIDEAICERIKKIYSFDECNIFFAKLSQWLTEQLQAILASETAVLKWPVVRVRSLLSRNQNVKSPKLFFPEHAMDIFPRFLSKSKRQLEKMFLISAKNTDPHLFERPFWIQFPDSNLDSLSYLSFIAPRGFKPIKIDFPSFYFGLRQLQQNEKILRSCMLAAQKHILIASGRSPVDGRNIYFVKHLGENETWIGDDNGDSLNLSLVPRNSWVALPENSLLILGRMIRNPEYPNLAHPLRGSMIVKIENEGAYV